MKRNNQRMRTLRQLRKVGLYSFITLVVVTTLYPYLVMLLSSLKSADEINRMPGTLLPENWVWTNYLEIWKTIPLATYLKNSFLIAAGTTVLAIGCAIPAAYALSRLEFKGSQLFLGIVVATQMFSPIILLVGIYDLAVKVHLNDSILGLILVNGGFNQAFAIWVLWGTFESISIGLEEAAMIDGCSRFRALRKVTLPLAAPGIVTALIFVFINGWNEYTLAFTVIASENKKPLTVGINAFFGYTNIKWWYLFAVCLVAAVPVIILFSVIEKRLVSGLTAGAEKG